MAVRLQMKLGVVAEAERLEDSPDTVAIVEPTIGATLRSKGSLYVVVAGTGRARKLQEATRLVADTVQGEYYYDESAGLIACLEKAVRTANRKLAASRERLGLGSAATGPVGLGVAVVRGSELYVTTAGPVDAYLVHQAHLLTLPDPNADQSLPVEELAPRIWRGEIAAGDTLVLVSRNITATLGTDELKDAVNTLHPQAAMEQVHHRFVAAGGSGSDGALAIEAAEVAATSQRGRLVPARPPEPLAGTPDRSPIPMADSVGGGVAAVSAGATKAKSAAGSAMGGAVARFQDLLPRRGPRYRRVTPAATRRESQRRAAVAVLAFVAIATVLGVGLWVVGGSGGTPIDEVTAGEKAVAAIKEDLRLVFHNGANLVADDPQKAEELLLDAYEQLGVAAQNGVPTATLAPFRAETLGGLDKIYGVVQVAPRTAFSFAGQAKPFDLVAMVLGPDGVPYVLDRTTKTVYRVDLRAKKATPVIRAGTSAAGTKVAEPRHLATGGPDVLALDAKNAMWRWRPADAKGKGTLARIRIAEATTWGADILGFGTYVRNQNDGLYNLYVIDPSEQQILRYSPAQDGSGYPANASGLPEAAGGRVRGDLHVHRRRGLPRGRRRRCPLRQRRRQQLGPRRPPRPAPAAGPAIPLHRIARRPRRGGHVRVRPRERPDHRLRQGQREVPRPVPDRRRRTRLERPARVLRRQPGHGPGPRHLLDQRRPDRLGHPSGRVGHPVRVSVGRSIVLAEGLGEADRQAEADSQAEADGQANTGALIIPVSRSPGPTPTAPARRPDGAWDNRPMAGRLIEMVVESVRVHMHSTQHVVILKELERERFLLIWIGPWEANAIAMKLQGMAPERPLTHDLFVGVLEKLGATIREVVIADLADETYRARILLELDGRIHEIDARPSDALALAVRAGVRVFATDAVLERAGVEAAQADDADETPDDERLSVFREFVNSLDMEPGIDEPREGRPRD